MSEAPARAAALWVLQEWQRGKPQARRPETLIRRSFQKFNLDPRDKSLAMELAYGVIRHLLTLDHIISFYIRENGQGVTPTIRDVLRLAAYQIGYLDKIPERAAVNEAVEAAKKSGGRAAAGFVNAVLRSLLRNPGKVSYPDPKKTPFSCLSLEYSYPEWLAMRWLSRFGFDEAASLMAAGNATPPLTLRANTLKIDRDSLVRLFDEAGIACSPSHYAPDGVTLETGSPITELPGYKDGLFAVQDEAAQLIPLLLAPKAGDNILDACAAPGGKSAHIAALAGWDSQIVAMDIGLDKTKALTENIRRLGVRKVVPLIADAAAPLPFKGPFDSILLDAPCSALGVIRRRPEIKYARLEKDIRRLAELQARMLRNLAPAVKPGGVLVYSVCSTEPQEGELLVDGFLKEDSGFVLEDARAFLPGSAGELVTAGGYMRTWPHRHGTDGFFAARLRKK
jgi:16S rRNA (cytosine967-C5)-methyltransferase